MSKYKRNNPFNQIYSQILAMLLIALITITLSLMAATIVPEARPVIHVMPSEIVMKRESLDLDPAFEEALNVSMKRGYCQAVNWEWAGVA